MKVAFDLDDTLVRCGHQFPLEPPKRTLWRMLLGGELMREGTTDLLGFCKRKGCDLWVYTSSGRSELYIRQVFWLYGFHLAGVVNQQKHDRTHHPGVHTKYPPAFGIDLLIDDSEGVAIEGRKYNFPVLLIAPDDLGWATKVEREVARMC